MTTDLWFTEPHSDAANFSIKVDKQLYSSQSKYQRIDVFESYEYGRFLTLDGLMMLTERDEFIYHDMIVHVPMAVNPAIKRVLVIGAGDGGTIRELTRYKTVEHIDMAEIDGEVVRVAREYLPTVACAFDDPRVHLHIVDGLKYVRTKQDEYDLIIVDSTDPFGPGEGLFTREFYGNCFKALGPDGILVNQHESPFYGDGVETMQNTHVRIRSVFPLSRVYQAHIPSYPSGHWLFGFASKGMDPLDFDADAWEALGLDTRYYNTKLHRGAFALPTYVLDLLKAVEHP